MDVARKAPLVGLAVVNLAVVAWVLLSFRDGVFGSAYRMDLDVYRVAVDVWWQGGDVYGELPRLQNGWHLPYLYPPVAVVVLAPFAVVPFWLASAVFVLVTIAALVLVLVVVLRALEVRPTAVLVGALLPMTLALEPVRETLYFGQINVLLMVLVVADCLVRAPRWPRGALVGIAAAVKLTPAVFVLFFLLRGDRRAAFTAGVSFLCATAIGFLASWPNSVRFWTHEVFHSAQFRGMSNEMNQSLKVLLVRFGADPEVLWPLLAAAALGVTAIGMRRAFAAGWPAWALGLNALGALLGFPGVVLAPLGVGRADPADRRRVRLAHATRDCDRRRRSGDAAFRPRAALVVGPEGAVARLAPADRKRLRVRRGGCPRRRRDTTS